METPTRPPGALRWRYTVLFPEVALGTGRPSHLRAATSQLYNRGTFRRHQPAVVFDKTELGFRERNANTGPKGEKLQKMNFGLALLFGPAASYLNVEF